MGEKETNRSEKLAMRSGCFNSVWKPQTSTNAHESSTTGDYLKSGQRFKVTILSHYGTQDHSGSNIILDLIQNAIDFSNIMIMIRNQLELLNKDLELLSYWAKLLRRKNRQIIDNFIKRNRCEPIFRESYFT